MSSVSGFTCFDYLSRGFSPSRSSQATMEVFKEEVVPSSNKNSQTNSTLPGKSNADRTGGVGLRGLNILQIPNLTEHKKTSGLCSEQTLKVFDMVSLVTGSFHVSMRILICVL